ncbi:SDR family NAD(P)-dependent oxidoreductase [Novosphingobium sp. PS1R-30]|uniref:SDR family NAD(P)-dependent oxidoreductase n=1 Tax=Novosphingobium anseongense TaxID=3133436 RepID=A0ABU8RU06_9SPHN
MSQPPVAIVTGSSRGAGRGIATALGSHGATVYVTGRSQKEGDASMPGTIHATAAEVTAAGGKGIAVACDSSKDEEVGALVEQVIAEQGRVDILINNACAIYDELSMPGNFWEKPLKIGDMINVGVRSGFVASWHVAPHMVRQGQNGKTGGLILFTSSPGAMHYCFGPAYGAHKAGLDKMAFDMGVDFADAGSKVAAVSIWMGALTSERLLEMIAAEPEKFKHLEGQLESTGLTGHVAWALFNDPKLLDYNGKTLVGADMAKHYGITDLGGQFAPSFREQTGIAPAEYGAYKVK